MLTGDANLRNFRLLNSDGTLSDTSSIDASLPYDTPDVAPLAHGNFLVAGSALSTPRLNVQRLLASGETDTSFLPPEVSNLANGRVQHMLPLPDGDVILSGWFWVDDSTGEVRKYLVRINADGSLDEGFKHDMGIAASDTRLVPLPDGKVLILKGGSDIDLISDPGPRDMVRLLPDGRVDQSFRRFAYNASVYTVLPVGPYYYVSTDVGLQRLWAEPAAPPGPPTAVTAGRSGLSVDVSWQMPTNDGRSPVQSYEVTSKPSNSTCTTAATSCRFENLAKGVTHTFTVVAINAAGPSVASEESNGVTITTAPSAPKDVSADRANGLVDVSWQEPADDGGLPISGYTVTSTPGGATCATDGLGRTCRIEGLHNGTTYQLTVTATNSGGTSPGSAPVSARPATTPGPAEITKVVAGFRSATVYWSPPASDGGESVTRYRVATSNNEAGCVAVSAVSCTVQGLKDFATYRFRVVAENVIGEGATSSDSASITLAGDVGKAVLTSSASRALTGSPVTLTAAESSSLSGEVTRIEWSIDSGPYTDGGNSISQAWSTPGRKTVRVRVTGQGGEPGEAVATITIFPKSAGEPGVSINRGEPYTTKKEVALTIGWPDWASKVRISNDGGFKQAETLDLGEAVQWQLDDTTKGAFTKVVYVRFSGDGIDETSTYSDDIILDTQAPVIERASATQNASPRRTSALAWNSKGGARYSVRVKAKDKLSGIHSLRVNTKPRPARAANLPYRKRSAVRLPAAKNLFVQVRDGAGNWTKWTKIVPKR